MKIKRKKMQADVPAMAMGDIAFNLLIFFVILARVQDDSHIQWQPAKAEELQVARSYVASIIIDREGAIYLDGKPKGEAAIEPALETMLAGRPAGERQILLKVDRETPAHTFEPVIEAIGNAGGELIHILEKQAEKKNAS